MAGTISNLFSGSSEENWESLDYVEFLNATATVTHSLIQVASDNSGASCNLFLANFMKFSCLIVTSCWHTITPFYCKWTGLSCVNWIKNFSSAFCLGGRGRLELCWVPTYALTESNPVWNQKSQLCKWPEDCICTNISSIDCWVWINGLPVCLVQWYIAPSSGHIFIETLICLLKLLYSLRRLCRLSIWTDHAVRMLTSKLNNILNGNSTMLNKVLYVHSDNWSHVRKLRMHSSPPWKHWIQ